MVVDRSENICNNLSAELGNQDTSPVISYKGTLVETVTDISTTLS